MRNCKLITSALLSATMIALPAAAEDYVIDSEQGGHSAVLFEISHLGIGLVNGRFNEFGGTFNYNEQDPSSAKVEVTLNPASVDTNFAERDKHIRSEDFLDVKRFPEARFVSTGFEELGDGKAKLTGELTLHGVTKSITIDVTHLGHGSDPWGGYRRGFKGRTRIALADFGIDTDLGPASKEADLVFAIEGIRQ